MKKIKILLIEDDIDAVEAMRIILEAKGYSVTSALDYFDGLSKAKALLPDLIILDAMLMINDKPGLEMPIDIRKDPKTAHIPILMLTAINEIKGEFEFSPGTDNKNVPIDEFMNKPARPEELYEKIEKLLELKVSKWANGAK